jgi:hypothetical protein
MKAKEEWIDWISNWDATSHRPKLIVAALKTWGNPEKFKTQLDDEDVRVWGEIAVVANEVLQDE